ncbi:unnamed protein product [Moneuplotes crassus]|uniref:Uncharacterized protein n=1 Tax=Euplotes crassus TaxID=5936 RepID=A0AAD1UAJ8_EUPCR|nr:unnamed protein product [Moneuplotes crassus]
MEKLDIGFRDKECLQMKIMKLTNYSCGFSPGFTIGQGFIKFKAFRVKCEEIEEASPTDFEGVKLLTEDLSVFIPMQEVKIIDCYFDEDYALFEGLYPKLAELGFKISPSALMDADAYEKLQPFQKTPKVWVDVERPYIRNGPHVQSKDAPFKVLEKFNLHLLGIRNWKISDEATLSLLNSLLEKTNIADIYLNIGASEIKNKEIERMFNALSASCFRIINIMIYEASLDIVKISENFAGKNIDKDIQIQFVNAIIKPEIKLEPIPKSSKINFARIKSSIFEQIKSKPLKPKVPTFIGSRFCKLRIIFEDNRGLDN